MASTSVQAPGFLQSRDPECCKTQASNAARQTHPTSSYFPDSFSLNGFHHTDIDNLFVGNIENTSGPNTVSSHYQSSDISDFDDDRFGMNLTSPFLDDSAAIWAKTAFPSNNLSSPVPELQNEPGRVAAPYTLTTGHTASLYAVSPKIDRKDVGGTFGTPYTLPNSISPRHLQKTDELPPVAVNASAFTQSLTNSIHNGQDGLDPAFVSMPPYGVMVKVEDWDNAPGNNNTDMVRPSMDGNLAGAVHIQTHAMTTAAGDLLSTTAHDAGLVSVRRDAPGAWQQETASRRAVLDPLNRPSYEVPSINEIAKQRAADEVNEHVARWRAHSLHSIAAPTAETPPDVIQALESSRDDDNDIPLGHRTENRYVPGQTYFEGTGGQVSDVDREIINSSRNWADAPVFHAIQSSEYGRHQPETSQAAITRFERMCRDNDSLISRSATWGTRRRSLPSVMDIEGVTSGNFLKKLSISRGNGEKTTRPGSFFKDLRGLVRRTSVNQLHKRSRSRSVSGEGEEANEQEETRESIRRESTPHLSPPLESTSSGKKTIPSLNTTLASMGQNIASMWTGHCRAGSVSGIPTTASPKTSLGSLTVRSHLRRPRSKSEIPKPSKNAAGMETMSSLVDMWSRSGGPPVALVSRANLSQIAPALATADEDEDEEEEEEEEEEEDDDDGEEEEEELYKENDPRISSHMIDGFAPSLAGFQQHVVKLNPNLGSTNGYLVDRIARHQIERYNQLLAAKVKHLGQGASCACGALCMALGGRASAFGQRRDPKELDPLIQGIENSEDLRLPIEGAIRQENFPADIPMPPTQYLPAEFECQLCFQKKRFRKPSDWTKHVHEDVQPFTCTWDRCRDAKMFKRKADWVRHENEGHRHLEWWTCDVNECRHTCYRRDNFLQHLVREHKFVEPKVKIKAAMKRAEGLDPTWQKVEECHAVTTARPQDEACRFCGKVLPTWKKLTVHLAKHMEQISLPILRLVAARDLSADTTNSPVRDLAPRQKVPLAPANSFTTIQPTQLSASSASAQAQAQAQTQQKLLHHGYDAHQGASFPCPNPIPSPAMDMKSYEQDLEDRSYYVLQQESNASRYQYTSAYVDNNSNSNSNSNSPFECTSASSDVEPFPQFSINAHMWPSVDDVKMSGQLNDHMILDDMANSPSVNGSPYNGGESLSTYSYPTHFHTTSSHNGQQQQQQQQQQLQPQQALWDACFFSR
ncbi:hypothetical protein E4U21_002776 [Claviceps maximensis]|nr:hypothetical protein E4U21_002776 [Claviceps maximensis]